MTDPVVGCRVCGGRLAGDDPRRRYCSAACRMRAHRARHAGAVTEPALAVRSRAQTVYECPACEARHLGQQRCPDCNVFCRRVGPGGYCPHCDEPVAVTDLIDPSA